MAVAPPTTHRPAPLTLEPGSPLAVHLRTVKVVCQRELLRLRGDKVRLVASLSQPFLFLFVMGAGLADLSQQTSGLDYRTFLYPGVLSMSVLFTAMFSAMSIVWDREFGFLREMLVAPVPRSAILVGKALAGAITATGQGLVLVALAGFAGVPYRPFMLAALVVQMFVLAFAVGSFGLVLAARIRQIQAFMGLMNLMVMPLFFLSGALYPLANLPAWLQLLAKLNPITYAVTAMRHTVFSELDLSPATRAAFDPGVTWFGWQVPAGLAVVVVAGLGAALLAVAVAEFRRGE